MSKAFCFNAFLSMISQGEQQPSGSSGFLSWRYFEWDRLQFVIKCRTSMKCVRLASACFRQVSEMSVLLSTSSFVILFSTLLERAGLFHHEAELPSNNKACHNSQLDNEVEKFEKVLGNVSTCTYPRK